MINFKKNSLSFLSVFTCVFLLCVVGFGVPAGADIFSDAAKAAMGDGYYANTINSYLSGPGGWCWFCPIFGGIFDAMNTLATAVSTKLSHIFLMVMGVGLLFSIAFKVGKMVTQLQEVDLMQFLTDMFKHLGRAIIATALLVSSLSIFTYLVSPILSMSMNLTTIIMEEGGLQGTVITALQGTGMSISNPCDEYKQDMQTIPDIKSQTMAFTPDVKASLLCAIKTMSSSTLFGIALGSCIYSLMMYAKIFGVLPNFFYAILGSGIMLAHIAILISFPFKLIDAMMRLAFVCALMPLWIILWVFPATVGYTKKAWDMFISSCLIFVCMSVVITLSMTLMTAALANREVINALLVKDKFEEAAAMINLGGKEFFVTVALCYMAWKLLGTATVLANSFTGSMPEMNMGSGLSQFTANSVKVAGKGAGIAAKQTGKALGIKPETMDKLGKGALWAGATVLTGGGALLAGGAFKGGLFGLSKASQGTRSVAKNIWGRAKAALTGGTYNPDGSITKFNKKTGWLETTKDGEMLSRERTNANGVTERDEYTKTGDQTKQVHYADKSNPSNRIETITHNDGSTESKEYKNGVLTKETNTRGSSETIKTYGATGNVTGYEQKESGVSTFKSEYEDDGKTLKSIMEVNDKGKAVLYDAQKGEVQHEGNKYTLKDNGDWEDLTGAIVKATDLLAKIGIKQDSTLGKKLNPTAP